MNEHRTMNAMTLVANPRNPSKSASSAFPNSTNQQKITIMKKLYFYALLLPLWGLGGLFGNVAFAQVTVELAGKTYTAPYTAPPQVSFTVSWGSKTPYDKIWVLAQYSASGKGAEDRALVTEVSATGATASTVTGHRGFWLETAGDNGSATVTATLSLAPGVEHFNWCVYAFDYPPNAISQPDGTYQLRGSPPFTINGNITEPTNTFGPGTCIESITDLTDNPAGIVPAPPSIAWSSGGDASQNVLIGNAVTPIIFTTAGATSVTPADLPDGVSGAWSSPDYVVSGTPSGTGTYNYTLTATNAGGCSATVSGTITVLPPGANQPEGSCTFTQPELIGTFANFPATYSASTFVTLQDERDRNNYTVVKMPDGKWWMAQNLNYQGTTQGSGTFELVWNQNSNQANGKAFTTTGAATLAIGSFWCPAGNGSNVATSSANRAGCTLYGALYSWETAMMVDGKWSDEWHSSSSFSEPTGQYGTSTTSGNTNNNARGVSKRGICPPNWHVPTDAEWGDMLTKASLNNTNFNNGTAWVGVNNNAGEAGARLKSKCICPSGNSGCVDDTKNNWFYSTNANNRGTDVYGFRALPAGYRQYDGSDFHARGSDVIYGSSSAYSATLSWFRHFGYGHSNVGRDNTYRSHGFPVRCVQD
jgi:uncharacterized protein (TIGR02145 family)